MRFTPPQRATDVTVELTALDDLLAAMKTQRDLDWTRPELRNVAMPPGPTT